MRGAPLLEQFLVHAVRPGGDHGPGEMFLDAPAAGATHGMGRGTVAQDAVERVGQRPGVGRRHEQARLPGDHDLGDAAHGAGHHRPLAGHRLEVDDAERLVHRRASEDRAVRIELDVLLLAQPRADPQTPGPTYFIASRRWTMPFWRLARPTKRM